MFKLTNTTTNVDISPWIISLDWTGDISQAARKLSFQIAYTKKDKSWKNCKISVGDKILLTYTDDSLSASGTDKDKSKNKTAQLFSGVVFLQSRNSASFTMSYTAYDNIIYLAKSKTTIKFSDCTIKDAITQVCNILGVTPGTFCDDCSKYKVNLVEDGKAGSEIINDCLDIATAWTGWTYHITMVDNKLNVIRCDDTVQSYKITDTTNLIDASHSASIENMVNQIAVVNKEGETIGYVKNDDDIKQYGLLQDVYKVDDKKDTATAAKAMLTKLAETSSISCIGSIQCIAGYAVDVTEEQINGKFLIASDNHKISNGRHLMDLTLRYITPASQSADSTTEGTLPAAQTTGTGNLEVNEGITAGSKAWVGATMANGSNGCVEAVGKVGSYYSPFLAGESNNGVTYVPQLVSDANSAGIPVIQFDSSQLEKGDTIVYGDNDHVVLYDGNGGYVGNSSSQNMVVQGGDYTNMGGLYPTQIIKTSHH
jgi:hypothetical protein